MPATPAEPPRRTTRRDQRKDQRRDQRRSWSALDTPHGFERCVRATLRELYGYVALLTGRDRREAERIVGDVYRSLFRAAGAGHVESVTLGALRSAGRRTWLDAHRVELAATDEVSRAAASTIAELSPLERAVLVVQHVNGMSAERAALELGRSEREIVAVGAHAVRRLRGTDDTSGAWLRAYLGPTVTPAAGLVDRIVQQLGEPEAPPADTADTGDTGEDDGADEHDADPAVREPVGRDQPDEPVSDGSDDSPAPSVGPEGGDVAGDAVADTAADPDTTELAIVDRPTVEVPTIVADPDTTELAIVDRPTVEVPTIVASAAGVDADDHSGEAPVTFPLEADEADAAVPGRPRWALAIGAVLVLALVVALVWLLLRGDPDDTVVSTPGTSADVAPPATDGAADDVTDDATDDGTDDGTDVSGADAETAVDGAGSDAGDDPDAVPAAPVELGFDPPCVERVGSEPAALDWSDTFGPLGEDAALTVALPESVDATADPERAAPRPSTILRPDGLIVAARPADGHGATSTVVARIGLDGTVAWVRCFDAVVRIGSSPDAGVELAVRPESDGAAWSALSLVDGSDGEALDTVQAAALDRPRSAAGDVDADADGPTLGYTHDGDLGRSVLAGLDGGTVLWTAPDVVLPPAGGFRALQVDDVALVQSCAETASGVDCAAGELRGYDLASGELAWARPGEHLVTASGDGVALVGDGTEWVLLDVRTGKGLEGQRWDATTFDVGADDEAGFAVRTSGALVVARPGAIAVWLPRDSTGDTTGQAIDVAIP